MQSIGEAFYIHCRMAHSQREYYLFENVLVSWEARKYRVWGNKCCIPESYGRLLISAHGYQ